MKTKHLVPVLFAALLCRSFAQQLPTTGTVESRLGKLELENGYPTSETAADSSRGRDPRNRASLAMVVTP